MIAVCGLAAAGCGPAVVPGQTRPRVRIQQTKLVTQGRRLFVEQRCGSCHALAAVRARGGSGPDFDTSERLDRAQILASLSEGANGMPSYAGRLSIEQRRAVTGFLYVSTHRGPR